MLKSHIKLAKSSLKTFRYYGKRKLRESFCLAWSYSQSSWKVWFTACSGNEINFQHHAPRVEFSCYRLWQILLLRNLVEIHLFDEYFAKLNLFLLHWNCTALLDYFFHMWLTVSRLELGVQQPARNPIQRGQIQVALIILPLHHMSNSLLFTCLIRSINLLTLLFHSESWFRLWS